MTLRKSLREKSVFPIFSNEPVVNEHDAENDGAVMLALAAEEEPEAIVVGEVKHTVSYIFP